MSKYADKKETVLLDNLQLLSVDKRSYQTQKEGLKHMLEGNMFAISNKKNVGLKLTVDAGYVGEASQALLDLFT